MDISAHDPTAAVQEFFERYSSAMLTRDEKTVAQLYAIPSLILFPDSTTVVTDIRAIETFFAAAWNQYQGVAHADMRITIMGHSRDSVWVDVTWTYDTEMTERFCYQLTAAPAGYQIAVLTPLNHDS